MRVLVGGDRLVPAGYCVDVLAVVCGPPSRPVRSLDRSGTKAGQRTAQQSTLRATPLLRAVGVARAGLENVDVAAAIDRCPRAVNACALEWV